MPDLSVRQRESILNAVDRRVKDKFYDPHLNGIPWNQRVAETKESIIQSRRNEEFEAKINALLRELKVSHVGFFHESSPKTPGRTAISATFHKYVGADGIQWMFQDVHEGGPASLAGVQTGDILLKLNDHETRPPNAPLFQMGTMVRMLLKSFNGSEHTIDMLVPNPKSKKHPVVIPKAVVAQRLTQDVGCVKVSMFPGAVGVEVANSISHAVQDLACRKIIFDLRGNSGGGMGCLRVMSFMTSGRLPVGYSLTRKQAQSSFDPGRFPKFDRIPSKKIGLLPLAAKFALRDKSIAVITEGLGPQLHHNRIAVLTNEHSASASEMIAAFAKENEVATIVGTKTAGRLSGANSFKVGSGYRVVLPVVGYRTWQGWDIDGAGVKASIDAQFCPEDLPRDTQSEAALKFLAQL